MRVGVLELLTADARPDRLGGSPAHWIARQYASIMPQAVSTWCRQLGHTTVYATYYGQADAQSLLPDDLDVVFLSTYTSASPLAYALARLFRRRGALTVLGGPHARAFPEDALRFFDCVVGDCDRLLIADILRDRPHGRLASGRAFADLPLIEERLPEIATATFWRGRPHPYAVVGLLASVGCPYRCDFCIDHDTPYVQRPLDRLGADLRFVATHWPALKIAFHDPNFAVRFDAVMETIERAAPGARNAYLMESSLSVLRESRVQRLRDTGCWYAAAGVESWADYSNKTGAGVAASGADKLEHVLEHFRVLGEHVAVVQANFIFGTDQDRGDEPVALTSEFMRRAPWVWPNVSIATPFGGTPLYERHRREGRVLEAMPFAFYNTPYLVTTPRHYDALEYYDKLAAILGELVSARSVRARLRLRRGMRVAIDVLRLLGIARSLREVRTLRALLRSDRDMRDFHDQRGSVLPRFYQDRWRQRLGRYAELLDADAQRPLLCS